MPSILLFQDFPWPSLKFHDLPGLEIEITNSMTFQVFHDLYEPCNRMAQAVRGFNDPLWVPGNNPENFLATSIYWQTQFMKLIQLTLTRKKSSPNLSTLKRWPPVFYPGLSINCLLSFLSYPDHKQIIDCGNWDVGLLSHSLLTLLQCFL